MEERDAPLEGKLILLRRGWFNKSFDLPVGKSVVGRADGEMPSDISVSNDDSMSRQSVEIEVKKMNIKFDGKTGGKVRFMFILTVLRTKNSVFHNGNELFAGDSVGLNFGDMIQLGKTKFRFDKK